MTVHKLKTVRIKKDRPLCSHKLSFKSMALGGISKWTSEPGTRMHNLAKELFLHFFLVSWHWGLFQSHGFDSWQWEKSIKMWLTVPYWAWERERESERERERVSDVGSIQLFFNEMVSFPLKYLYFSSLYISLSVLKIMQYIITRAKLLSLLFLSCMCLLSSPTQQFAYKFSQFNPQGHPVPKSIGVSGHWHIARRNSPLNLQFHIAFPFSVVPLSILIPEVKTSRITI